MESRKVILMTILFLSLGVPTAYATSYAILHLDIVGGNIEEGSTVTFSGKLTSFNGTAIPHRTIFIEDDTTYLRPDIILAITTTDSDGKFSVSWKAVPKDNGNSFHFYAKYLGGNFFGYARSESYESTIEKTDQSSTDVVPSIPIWFKTASKMWRDGHIRDIDYSFSIRNLIDHGIIKSNVTVGGVLKFPAWVKINADRFANDDISMGEYTNSLQYLLENKIIKA